MVSRSTLPTLLVLVVFGLFTAGFYSRPVVVAPVTLPIEVLGPTNYTQTATVNVTNSTGVDRLWIQGHRMAYRYGEENKASVKINNGPWIDINNQNVQCVGPSADYGCIGGALFTVQFTLPVNNVVDGPNTISFRFNGTLYASSGYRILDFNFLRGNGTKAIAASEFEDDDPTQWLPPLTSQADIDAGRDLWNTAELVDSPAGSAGTIRAKCADCHAKSGKDLQYFAYSNWSIIARSEFHGLTEHQGKQIASYIRSLDWPVKGRPWNPPYQPGPGLDSKPVNAWAAGAGLDAVLDSDEEMSDHLFPNGLSHQYVNTEATTNLREIPIAIQLPDWNEWLPRIHPKDTWNSSFTNHEIFTFYRDNISNLGSYSRNQLTADQFLVRQIETWGRWYERFKSSSSAPASNFMKKANQLMGLEQWYAVKAWEAMHGNGVEDLSAQLYSQGEARSWVGTVRSVFNVAPHIFSPANNTDDRIGNKPVHGSSARNVYMSSIWYELQTILNAGNRAPGEIKPVDWGYTFGHNNLARSGYPAEPYRYFKAYLKLLQIADNPAGVSESTGWRLRHITLANLLEREQTTNALPAARRAEVLESLVRAFTVNHISYDLSSWPRKNSSGTNHNFALEHENYVPTPHNGGQLFDNTTYADHFYRAIPLFYEAGVRQSVLDSLVTWSKAAWPNGNWNSLLPNTLQPPVVDITSPSPGAEIEVGSVATIRAEASAPSGTVTKVEFFINGSRERTDNSAPFKYDWTPTSEGTHVIKAKVTDSEGQTKNDNISVTVVNTAPPPSPPTVSITSPTNGEEFETGQLVEVQATATSTSSTISKVEFLVDGAVLLTDMESPYKFDWTPSDQGGHEVKVRAVDADGLSTTSSAVNVTIVAPTTNKRPVASFASPNDGDQVTAPGNFSVRVNASDVDGNVVRVKLFVNGNQHGIDTTAPYEFSLSNLDPGTYSLRAVAQDDGGKNGAKTISVTVLAPDLPNISPTGRITSPAAEAEFTVGDAIEVTAFANDADGTVAKVIFYADGTWFGEDNTSPFKRTLQGATEGAHQLHIVVEDNEGLRFTSESIAINVVASSDNGGPTTSRQIVQMVPGWNMVSSYIVPADPSISEMLKNVRDKIILVKAADGSIYYPDFGIDTIGDWDPNTSYLIYAREELLWSISGTELDPQNSSVSLSAGWNQIPFISKTEVDIEAALSSIADELVIAKDFAGRIYYPEFGINEIGQLEPGQGYKVYVESDATLNFGASGSGKGGSSSLANGQLSGASNSEVLIVRAGTDGSISELIARSADGSLLAEASVVNGIAVMRINGDEDVTTDIVEGPVEGQVFEIFVRNSDGQEVRADIRSLTNIFTGQEITSLSYISDAVMVVDLGDIEIPETVLLDQNYPNPFNPATTIGFTIVEEGQVRLEVFNSIGELVTTVRDEFLTTGSYSTTVEMGEYASGVYLYRLTVGTISTTKTMLLLK